MLPILGKKDGFGCVPGFIKHFQGRNMNNKTRKQRLWKVEFRKKYQQRILDTVEQQMGLPADCLCVFIAKLAERLSAGKLSIQFGILVIDDLGKKEPPLSTAHCWNMLDGHIFDLSPLANRYSRIEYLTEDDGKKYEFYKQQTIVFEEPPEGYLEGDINLLEYALHCLA